MANCKSCGGVIGRDCFNPQECEYIGYLQDQEKEKNNRQQNFDLLQRVIDLQNELNYLNQKLYLSNGIERFFRDSRIIRD